MDGPAMRKRAYRTSLLGISSPVLAGALGAGVYTVLTRASENKDADFVLRLSLTAAAMALPFVATLVSALLERRRASLTLLSKIGVVIAALSLSMVWLPLRGAMARARQAANLALEGVPVPEMITADIGGNTYRLSEYRGKVVLLNIWRTWCPPCRKEMPELDRLYRERKGSGLVVLGLSTEETDLQREYARELGVSYPLLTDEGQLPEVFTRIARYPANFLIDRRGMLRRAPSTDEPFVSLVRAVEHLLAEPGS